MMYQSYGAGEPIADEIALQSQQQPATKQTSYASAVKNDTSDQVKSQEIKVQK